MITVKIPAAIRVCSPVYMETPHGAMVNGIAVRLQPENGTICVFASDEDIWNAPAALVSLVISDPTGAAHLAWWLQKQPKQAKLAAVNAMQIKGLDLLVVAEQAMNGMPIDDAGLTLLRDYALRVVSHG